MFTRILIAAVFASLIASTIAGTESAGEQPTCQANHCLRDDVLHVHGKREIRVWNSLSVEQHEQIKHFLVIECGLSSTGRIELFRVFNQFEYSGFAATGDPVLQFDQLDLFGERLFWSYLVNVKNGRFLRLFSHNDGTPKGEWRKQDSGTQTAR